MTAWMRRTARVAFVGLFVLAVHGAAPVATQQALRTQAEESGFKEYTSYENMLAYLRALQATTPEMKLSTYGETWSNRELPYAIFSRPMISQPWEAMASGKPIVLFQANVHGGERTQRESLMILMRELATPGSQVNAYLDHIVLLIVPQVNPDGFSAQPNATRGNAWGIDLTATTSSWSSPRSRVW
jgi:murein tripeptide amidase MpaA